MGAWGAMPGAFATGITAIAVGGSLFMFAALHATFMFPRSQSTAMAAISCLFDGSTVVFAVVCTNFLATCPGLRGPSSYMQLCTHAREFDPSLNTCALALR